MLNTSAAPLWRRIAVPALPRNGSRRLTRVMTPLPVIYSRCDRRKIVIDPQRAQGIEHMADVIAIQQIRIRTVFTTS
ncbi:hypothetical protein KCP74_21665 [Salmonella enterica subsp. enterica]|nr:hypothetical protein KCP74_21665 [Salmonella enterica subsp. enterica]